MVELAKWQFDDLVNRIKSYHPLALYFKYQSLAGDWRNASYRANTLYVSKETVFDLVTFGDWLTEHKPATFFYEGENGGKYFMYVEMRGVNSRDFERTVKETYVDSINPLA